MFTSGVVIGEGMVVVIEAFPNSTNSDKQVLSWTNVLVVRLVTPHMGSTVHTPCYIEQGDVSEHSTHKEAVPQTLTPEVPGHHGRHDETQH